MTMTLSLRTAAAVSVLAFAASCSLRPPEADYELADAFRGQGPASQARDIALGEEDGDRDINVRRGPRAFDSTGETLTGSSLNFRVIEGPSARGALENVTLPVFIDTVFAEILGLVVEVDEAVTRRKDSVTLRVPRDNGPEALYEAAVAVLRTYGLGVQRLTDTTVRITTDDTLLASTPQFIRGRAGPGVDAGLRPVFQAFPVENARRTDLANWIARGVADRVRVQPLGAQPAILLMGPAPDVAEAARIARFFDQPDFAGRASMAIEPVYWSASGFAEQLRTLLQTEGFDVAIGPATGAPIVFTPVQALNTLFVFTNSEATMDRIETWARELDRPSQVSGLQRSFVYFVRNTTAEELGALVGEVLSIAASGGGTQTNEATSVEGAAGAAGGAQAGGLSGGGRRARGGGGGSANDDFGRLVVDTERNAVIFAGTAQNYERVRELLEQLDRAPKTVLIEVIVASISLTENRTLGVNITEILRADGFNVNFVSPFNAGGTATISFVDTDDDADTAPVALIDALASNSRISVLSKPNLIVRSGETATLNSTQDIPVLTGTLASGDGAGLVSTSISTRSAGVILNIEPVVFSNDRIDVVISQEVSSTIEIDSGADINSPAFSTQSVQTALSLRDGQTAYIGGLISRDRNRSVSGVPILKDIPVLGNAFRSQSTGDSRSELVVFITAYVVNGDDEVSSLASGFRNRIERFEDGGLAFRWW